MPNRNLLEIGSHILILDPGRAAEDYQYGWIEEMSELVGNVYQIMDYTRDGCGYRIMDEDGATWFIDPKYTEYVTDDIEMIDYVDEDIELNVEELFC